MNDNLRQLGIRKIRNIILIVLAVVIIVGAIFIYFMLETEVHTTLREAKNITMNFELLSVEYYGKGLSVYNPIMPSGLEKGVSERLEKLAGEPVNVTITSYSKNERKVKGFIYENSKFRVIYSLDKEGKEQYLIEKLVHVATYEY